MSVTCQPFQTQETGASSAAVPGASVQGLLRLGSALVREAGGDTPELDTELLLAEVLGTDRLRLRLDRGRAISAEAAERYAALIRRRVNREPVAYILGRKEFWSLDFAVGPGVLVPRPETEHLVEAVLERRRGQRLDTLIDLCCGAAPLAVSLSRELRPRLCVGVDRSLEALGYARRNVLRHGLSDQVLLVAGDLMTPLRNAWTGSIDLIVCNPPYIPSSEVGATMPEVSRHEPWLALDGGPSGLELSARVLRQAAEALAPGGALVLETGAGLMERLIEMAKSFGYRGLAVLRDLAGRERGLWVEKEGGP